MNTPIKKAQCRLMSVILNSSELTVSSRLELEDAANGLYNTVKEQHSMAKEQLQIEKPPIGIIPKYLWDEQRKDELSKAIYRYINVGRKVPEEWWIEYNRACTK